MDSNPRPDPLHPSARQQKRSAPLLLWFLAIAACCASAWLFYENRDIREQLDQRLTRSEVSREIENEIWSFDSSRDYEFRISRLSTDLDDLASDVGRASPGYSTWRSLFQRLEDVEDCVESLNFDLTYGTGVAVIYC